MAYFVLFCNSIATPIPPPLFFSTSLTSLLKMFWAIQQELFFLFWKNFPISQEKNHGRVFWVKWLAHSIQICWSGTQRWITEIKFWYIFQNSYYMESLQVTDKFCLRPLVIFPNMAYIFINSHKKSFHLLCIFHHHDFAMLCVYLTFTA